MLRTITLYVIYMTCLISILMRFSLVLVQNAESSYDITS